MKQYKNAWAISLLIIGTISMTSAISSLTEFQLPDALKWVFVVLDLAAVFVLIYTSVKLRIWEKGWNK